MSIDEVDKLGDSNDVPMLRKILNNIHNNAMGLEYRSTAPTASNVPFGKAIIHDDGAGTKRLYFRTGKDNVEYVGLGGWSGTFTIGAQTFTVTNGLITSVA